MFFKEPPGSFCLPVELSKLVSFRDSFSLCLLVRLLRTTVQWRNVFSMLGPWSYFRYISGVPAEGDAGNAVRGHLAGGLHRRPGHRLLAHQGSHVRRRLGGRAVPLQVSLGAPWLLFSCTARWLCHVAVEKVSSSSCSNSGVPKVTDSTLGLLQHATHTHTLSSTQVHTTNNIPHPHSAVFPSCPPQPSPLLAQQQVPQCVSTAFTAANLHHHILSAYGVCSICWQ